MTDERTPHEPNAEIAARAEHIGAAQQRGAINPAEMEGSPEYLAALVGGERVLPHVNDARQRAELGRGEGLAWIEPDEGMLGLLGWPMIVHRIEGDQPLAYEHADGLRHSVVPTPLLDPQDQMPSSPEHARNLLAERILAAGARDATTMREDRVAHVAIGRPVLVGLRRQARVVGTGGLPLTDDERKSAVGSEPIVDEIPDQGGSLYVPVAVAVVDRGTRYLVGDRAEELGR